MNFLVRCLEKSLDHAVAGVAQCIFAHWKMECLIVLQLLVATFPVAVESSIFKSKLQQSKKIPVAVFGDRLLTVVLFGESLNLAGLQQLPMLFLCI